MKVCNHCREEFKCALFRSGQKFCSRKCFFKSGILSTNTERSEKIRLAMVGRIISPEWRRKISLAKKGKKNPKISLAKKGIRLSPEHRRKIGDAVKKAIIEGRHRVPQGFGEKNTNWRGGISEKGHILRTSKKFRVWRDAVYKKDKHTCQNCEDNRGGNLHPHHIKEWYDYPELRFVVSNGITLCKKCHQELHKGKNYGRDNQSPRYKAYFYRYFNRVSQH